MVYQVNVQIEETKIREFLNIIESFKKIGLVQDYQNPNDANISLEIGNADSDSTLLEMVQTSRKQIADGEGLTTEEIKEHLETWRKTKTK